MIASVLHAFLFTFARGGGGGHGGGGGGGGFGGGGGGYYGGGGSGGGSIFSFIFFFFIFIPVIVYIIVKSKKNSTGSLYKNVSNVSTAEWPDGATEEWVSKSFYSFQADWSGFNMQNMQTYLSARYFPDVQLMMTALYAMGRQNVMEEVQLLGCSLLSISDEDATSPQTMVVVMHGQAHDSLVETSTNTTFYTDTSDFVEYWYFVNENGAWKLDNIKQATEDENVLVPEIQNFATTHGYFYSGEWGSLLLPTHGKLFENANFNVSAVNNHVIGLYKNVIIEFYSYLPDKNYPLTYTVAQAVLPKSYGHIIVHRKSGILDHTPRGLTKVEMEWGDFNKKFAVYASDMERVTSFELLNPSFMVKLEALPFEVDIEVVDNMVYLHTKRALTDYDPMLNILYLAFQEMKM